ncbi:hypothetical protein C8Q75DRAFT_803290 [Abortiporus biennis]|nr:hypothetical protein C8Q75DRAFT_803290 [Abortiporus biennis]
MSSQVQIIPESSMEPAALTVNFETWMIFVFTGAGVLLLLATIPAYYTYRAVFAILKGKEYLEDELPPMVTSAMAKTEGFMKRLNDPSILISWLSRKRSPRKNTRSLGIRSPSLPAIKPSLSAIKPSLTPSIAPVVARDIESQISICEVGITETLTTITSDMNVDSVNSQFGSNNSSREYSFPGSFDLDEDNNSILSSGSSLPMSPERSHSNRGYFNIASSSAIWNLAATISQPIAFADLEAQQEAIKPVYPPREVEESNRAFIVTDSDEDEEQDSNDSNSDSDSYGSYDSDGSFDSTPIYQYIRNSDIRTRNLSHAQLVERPSSPAPHQRWDLEQYEEDSDSDSDLDLDLAYYCNSDDDEMDWSSSLVGLYHPDCPYSDQLRRLALQNYAAEVRKLRAVIVLPPV